MKCRPQFSKDLPPPRAERPLPSQGPAAAPAAAGGGISPPPYRFRRLLAPLGLLSTLALAAPGPAPVLDRALDTEQRIQAASAATQKRVDELDDASRHMLEEYRRVSAELDGLKAWNDRLERTVRGQEAEVERLGRELESSAATRRGIEPLMVRMQSVLAEFVARDLPFLSRERQARLERLEALAGAPEPALAERFRSLLEAYQVEGGYGHGVEAYRGRLDDGSERLVDFLRLGRVALYYRTLDGAEAGTRRGGDAVWTALTPAQARELGHALRVARKELPPDLLVLPVPAPEAAP